jgi:thiol-disulfide isomerase/thioredoxin
MNRISQIAVLLFFFLSCYPQGSVAQVKVIRLPELQSMMKSPGDKPLMINFWATWCKPCVQELPYFQRLADSLPDRFELVFVSLDFAADLEKKVIPFAQRRQMKQKVFLLDEPDYNSWIDLVAKEWSGAIPGTLMLSADRSTKVFFEKEYHSSAQIWLDFLHSSNQQTIKP